MKPFLLFSGSEYYPSGGADDFRGAFATAKEAFDEANKPQKYPDDWYHVVRFTGETFVRVRYVDK